MNLFLGWIASLIIALGVSACNSGADPEQRPIKARLIYAGVQPNASVDSLRVHIYAVNTDGSGVQQLSVSPFIDAHPSWSFDGKQICFTRQEPNGQFDIWVMNADGTGHRKITHSDGQNMVPCFSPDGNWIFYCSDADGNYELYKIRTDGSLRTQLTVTNAPVENIGPKVSPDGKTLAYASNRDRPGATPITKDLYLLDLSTGISTCIVSNIDNGESRSWSPDGLRIAFHNNVDSVGQICIVEVATKAVTQLTQAAYNPNPFQPGGVFPVMRGEVTPHWTPDGQRIIFASDRAGGYLLCSIKPDGSDAKLILTPSTYNLSPNLQPLP
jgi:dipeptidyl aminopeptidase/acylaminoacyl peptidase